MNWKRGFLRLWIVLSAAWVTLFCYWIYERIADSSVSTYYYSAVEDKLSRTYNELVEKPYFERNETLTISWKEESIIVRLVTDLPDRKLVLVHAPANAKKANFVEPTEITIKPILDRAVADRKKERREQVTNLLLFALLPPLAVLCGAILVAWILSGFIRTKE